MLEFKGKRWSRIFYYALTTVIIGIGCICSEGSTLAKNSVYRSTAIVELNKSSLEQLVASEGLIPKQKSWDINRAIINAKSSSMVESIIEELNLDKNITKKRERRKLIERIRDGIEINLLSPGIIEFSVIYDDPFICQKIVNRLIRFFIKDRLYHQDEDSEENMEWLDNELEFQRKRRLNTEEAIESFRKENQNISIYIELAYSPDSAGINFPGVFAKRYEKYSQELLDSGIEYKTLKAEEKLLVEELAKTAETIIIETKTDRNTDKVVLETKGVNPVYQALQLDLMRCLRKISGIEENIEIIKEITRMTVNKLKQFLEKEREYAGLMRKLKKSTEMIEQFTSVKEKVSLMRRLEIRNRGTYFRVLEAAEVPREPYIPD
jgi:uncharacterized protein involved in exopolysaccharide biosynthesis